MSRNFITAALTIGVGVFTGYYTFQPALQELAVQKAHGQVPGSSPDESDTKKDTSIPVNPPAAISNPAAPGSESSK
ncbi:uncharacterized protein N7484_005896 [Penicillium longicatenatum]|uniref:uncharacterized protein n=1 Tax=Penicillium longicatenatum TaxID=1561947 RepID=UPI002549392A|nr:uncharacterized protein N7484_005896 [Penicillium longicatenatum]KAJ5643389.1 hypothetical protein N7484_005896 [Penicillium longicatenatum]